MDRRSFMKAVGVGLCLAALPVTKTQAEMSIQELIKARGNDSCDTSLIQEHCENSFIPEWHQYEAYLSGEVKLLNIEQIAVSWTGVVNSHPVTLTTTDKRVVICPPETLIFSSVSGQRYGLIDQFKARFCITRITTGSFNDTFQIYESADFNRVLPKSDWIAWPRIKENV